MRRPIELLAVLILFGCSPAIPKKQIPQIDKPELEKLEDTDGKWGQNKADLLFVIDNSGSMYDHQTRLATNMGKFAENFFKNQNVDYHIGIVSTDMYTNGAGNKGELISRYVTSKTQGPVEALSLQVSLLGTSGSGSEQLFAPVRAVVESAKKPNNQGFLREGSMLFVIFVTDAEDQSSWSVEDFYKYLGTLKGSYNRIMLYGVIVRSADNPYTCPRDEFSTKPLRIEEVLLKFDKLAKNVMSLCDDQYGDKLAEIGKDIAYRAGAEILLESRPIPETIRVSFGTQVLLSDPVKGWLYNPKNNSIRLGRDIEWSDQPFDTRLKISYQKKE